LSCISRLGVNIADHGALEPDPWPVKLIQEPNLCRAGLMRDDLVALA
jgi:hypothetical protein